MKKDLDFSSDPEVLIAIAHGNTDNGDDLWEVYLINALNVEIENAIVVASGERGGIKSATNRYLIKKVPPRNIQMIEIIMADAQILNHKYWLSYYKLGEVRESRFILESESFTEAEWNEIPLLNKQGISLQRQ
jgi:hypothetical protein